MSAERPSTAARRYAFRFAAGMTAYVAVLVAVVFWLQLAPPTGLVRYGAAILPALPLIFCIWAMGGYLIDEPDEFQRMIVVRSVLWGVGGVLVVTTVLGFLETFAETPRAPLYLVFPLFAVIMGVAQVFVRRAYR